MAKGRAVGRRIGGRPGLTVGRHASYRRRGAGRERGWECHSVMCTEFFNTDFPNSSSAVPCLKHAYTCRFSRICCAVLHTFNRILLEIFRERQQRSAQAGSIPSFYKKHMGVLQASSMGWNGAPALAGTLVIKKVVRLDVPVDKYPNVWVAFFNDFL